MREDLASLDAPATDRTHFVFGGVAFEICPGPGVTWAVGAEHRLFTGAYATSPVAGTVHCVVSPAPELESEPFTREIRWEWAGEVARVETGRMRAELRRLGPGRYAATAMVVPSANGCSALVTALTAAVVNREGGFVLHSAGVELDGRAVLFIGPSGAGKTTAANHCRGARSIAHDRAAVYPTPLGWYAAGMPGGERGDLAAAPKTVFPLAGVLRPRRAGCTRVTAVSPVSALRDLRESAMAVHSGPGDEAARLEALLELANDIRTGEVSLVLGDSLRDHLRRWAGGTEWA